MAGRKLIFIVDDDQIINTLIMKRFSSLGYRVEAFSYGEECLNSLGMKPDLIILDYYFINSNKKVMDGMEIFDKIKETKPDIPVIMLSGQDKGEIVLELARKGIVDYIIKDNNLIDNLLLAMDDLFKK